MAVKRPKANTKSNSLAIQSIVFKDPRLSAQLFDPFFGSVSSGFAKKNPTFLNSSKSMNEIKATVRAEGKLPSANADSQRKGWYEDSTKSDDELLRRKAYEFAYYEFKKGIREQGGDNQGSSISADPGNGYKSYQSTTGKIGMAWCASFVTWCYWMAGWTTLVSRDEKDNPFVTKNLALAQTWGEEIGSGNHIRNIKPENAVAGDTIVFGLETSDPGNDHVGIFSQWLIKPSANGGVGLFTSIEGNTGPDQSVTVNGKNLIYSGGSPESGEGVFGKKHIYQASSQTDPSNGKTITFSRIFR